MATVKKLIKNIVFCFAVFLLVMACHKLDGSYESSSDIATKRQQRFCNCEIEDVFGRPYSLTQTVIYRCPDGSKHKVAAIDSVQIEEYVCKDI